MGLKFSDLILILILTLTLFITVPPVIAFIQDVSKSNGEMSTASTIEIDDSNCGYSITYNLDGGIVTSNPELYNLFSETFTLKNPTKDGYEFIGWTGSNGETPQIKVTICTGSSGDLEFTANYALILDAPEVELNDNTISWNSIENANAYFININGKDVYTTDLLSHDLLTLKEYCHAGSNIVKVKATNDELNKYAESDYSNSIYFSVTQLETPVVSINDFNINWNAVENAKEYVVTVGAYTLTTTDTSVNLLNHLDWITTSETSIRVKAVASETSLEIDSENSQTVKFIKPTLASVNLTLSQNNINWNYNSKVENYEIYVNSVKVLTTSDKSSISIDELASYFTEGSNIIYVTATANGYTSAQSNSISYKYYDVTQFENLTLNTIGFSKTSSGYVLTYNSDLVVVRYNFNGVQTGGLVDDSLNDSDLTLEEILLKCINPKKEISKLTLNVGIKELLEYICNSYVEGQTQQTLSVAGMFKYIIADQYSTEFIPDNLSINVTYGEMYNEALFYEGCIVKLNDCNSTNAFEFANAQGLDSNNNKEKWINCGIRIYNDLYPKYIEYNYTVSNGTAYYYIDSISNTTAISESDFNNYLKDCKFYINSNYYLKIKGNFSDFYKAIFNEVCSLRNSDTSTTESYNWTYERITYTIDITKYFNVYSNDGTLINFNYTLTADCVTARTV